MKTCAETSAPVLPDNEKNKNLCLLKQIIETIYDAEFDYFTAVPRYKHTKERKYSYRNGHGRKKLKTVFGDIDLNPPRDRSGKFKPVVIKKRQRNIYGFEDNYLSLLSCDRTKESLITELEIISDTEADRGLFTFISDKLVQLSEEIDS